MKKLKGFISKGVKLAGQSAELANDARKATKEYWDKNKDELQEQGKEAFITGQEYVTTTYESVSEAASSIYHDIKYSDSDLKKLQQNIENQGGYYRELSRRSTTID